MFVLQSDMCNAVNTMLNLPYKTTDFILHGLHDGGGHGTSFTMLKSITSVPAFQDFLVAGMPQLLFNGAVGRALTQSHGDATAENVEQREIRDKTPITLQGGRLLLMGGMRISQVRGNATRKDLCSVSACLLGRTAGWERPGVMQQDRGS